MEKQRKLKVIILSTLIIGVLTLTIAFSALSRTLNIGGVGKMDTATWDVHFENLSDAKITRDAIEISKPNISLDKGTVENINVKLTKPKDEIKYVVDIVNKGTIDAEVNIITISDLTDEQKKLIDFGVYYLNGTKITKYDLLEPEDVKSIVIKIRYKDDITEFDLPNEPIKINLSCQIEYVQSNAEMVITPENNLENVTSVLAEGNQENETFFNGTLEKDKVENISFLSTLKVPTDARNTAWDASLNKDGSVVAWYTDLDNNGLYELKIDGNKEVIASKNSSYFFSGFSKLKEINFSNFNTSTITNMDGMFQECTSLKSLDLSSFNTSNVTSMHKMFSSCSSLEELNFDNFDFSSIEHPRATDLGITSTINLLNMNNVVSNKNVDVLGMFIPRKVQVININNLKLNNVTSLASLFSGLSETKTININGWDTSNVTDMGHMFDGCSSLTTLDLSTFDTSNVIDMRHMFLNCAAITSLDLSSFDTSKVRNMSYMFKGCASLTNIDLSSFDTSNVTDMSYMFNGCTSLTSLDLSSFNMINLTAMSDMFSDCTSLMVLNLSNAEFNNIFLQYSCMYYFMNTPKSMKVYVKDEFVKQFIDRCSGCDSIIGSP